MENKAQIIELLETKHQDLIDFLAQQPNKHFNLAPENKNWNTAQHVEHLVKSMRPVNQFLRLPKFFISYKFGKANRKSRTYDQLVERYLQRMSTRTAVAPARFSVDGMKDGRKIEVIKKLEKEHKRFVKLVQKWSEADMDTYILPHPLLGKTTVREIFFFTAYHTEHHCKLLKEHYQF